RLLDGFRLVETADDRGLSQYCGVGTGNLWRRGRFAIPLQETGLEAQPPRGGIAGRRSSQSDQTERREAVEGGGEDRRAYRAADGRNRPLRDLPWSLGAAISADQI